MARRLGLSLVESKKHVIVLLIAIMITLNSLFFYFQWVTEQQIKDSLFEQQKDRQIETTRSISQHIGSDLRTIASFLMVLADNPELKDGDMSSDATKSLARKTLQELNVDREDQGGAPIDRLFIIDSEANVQYSIDYPEFVPSPLQSRSLSDMQHIQETEETVSTVFSRGYIASDGTLRIAVTYPIIGSAGEYNGQVGVSMPTGSFFHYYGNVYDIESQYLAVLDADSLQLVHPVQSFVGTRFFGEFTQSQTGRIESLNDLVRNTLDGGSGFAIYEFGNGERLTSGQPIIVGGVPTYFVFVITPTTVIYSSIDSILASERTQTLILLIGVTFAIATLIILLLVWNRNLDVAVLKRTAQLEESNKQLHFANEQLIEVNEQLEDSKRSQEEFINVAAHELRTPIQPIIGLADILLGRKEMGKDERTLLAIINRNAQRLQHLASNILDVTRIESNALRLNKTEFDIKKVLSETIDEYWTELQDKRIMLRLLVENEIIVSADRERIIQVIYNILSNAGKYSEEGEITIAARVGDSGENIENRSGPVHREAVISIQDTGPGIDPEIMPKLFTKFTTKSNQGTGLGLFIAKSIVEAHGGRIWAENNGKGAIFSFTLPLVRNS